MTYDDFLAKKKTLHLTNDNFAQIVGYSEAGIKKWKINGVPNWAEIVLDHLLLIQEMQNNIDKYIGDKVLQNYLSNKK